MSFHISPQYPRDSRQLLIVVILSCFSAAQSVDWHMPDLYQSKVAVATTTQCNVCGTVVPPVIVPGSARTTTPALPVTTTIPAPPFAPSRYMVTTTTPPYDPYQHGPDDVTTTWPMKSKTGVIAGVATAGAVAVGGLIAGIVAIAQHKPSSTTPERFLAATTTNAISLFTPEGTAPGTNTVSHVAHATPSPTSVAKGSSGIQAKYDSAKIAHMGKVNENGVTAILVAGCIVFAVILLAVGFGTYFLGSYTRRTRTLYLQAENRDEPHDGDESVSDMSCDDELE